MSDESQRNNCSNSRPRPTRKLVTLSAATAAAVENYRHSERMRRASISMGLPSESETLRRLVEIGLDHWERRNG
jgi:hypothetical protein